MSQGVPALGSVKQGWGVKTSYFRAKCVGDACITGCAVAQHCCNDDQQSQWENKDFDPL